MMTILTALEIATNFPENILINAHKDPDSKNWTSIMYMTRNDLIHKTMISFNNYPYKSKKEALNGMHDLVLAAIEYVKEKVKENDN